MAKSGIDWIQMQFKRNNLPGFFHGDKLLGTGLTFWFILNGVVALILFSPMSCMSLFEFATPQLWQDYVKNMPLWVSKELWHSNECILIFSLISYQFPNRYYSDTNHISIQTDTDTHIGIGITNFNRYRLNSRPLAYNHIPGNI